MSGDPVTNQPQTAQPGQGLSRRGFLLAALVGAAAALGLGAALRRRFASSDGSPGNPLGLDEDSIFYPREDALRRMRGDH